MADVCRNCSADLGANALVSAEQRHVPVSRPAGDDLNKTSIVEVAEAGGNITVESPEVFQRLREKAMPEARRFCEVGFAGLDEESLVFTSCDDLAVQVIREFRDEDGVGQLLQQHWRKIEIAMKADVIAFKTPQNPQQREVRFSRSLVKPFHAVRPGAMVDDVRQMSVQCEG